METATCGALAKLAPMRQWVAWREEPNDAGRLRKVPYVAVGRKAKANKPESRLTREQAEALLRRFSATRPPAGIGLGLQLGSVCGDWCIGGVDLDVCRDPTTGALEPWAAEVLDYLRATYAELSPSGRGLHALFAYHLSDRDRLRDLIGGNWKRTWAQPAPPGEKAPAIELHLGGGYFTVSEAHVPGTGSRIRTVPLKTLEWLAATAGPRLRGIPEAPPAAATPAAQPAAAPAGPGFLRLAPAVLLRLASLDDLAHQIAMAHAGHSAGQHRQRCRTVAPHSRLSKLPGARPGSTRGAGALAKANASLRQKGLLRLLTAAERPKAKGSVGKAAAFDATFLHTGSGEGSPAPRVRWSRLAIRRWLWLLSPKASRLLTLLVARHGLAPTQAFPLSDRELAGDLATDRRQAGAARDELGRHGLLVADHAPKQGRAGRYRLGGWNEAEEVGKEVNPLPSLPSTGTP